MIRKYTQNFCWKNVSSFCSAKATHIFSAKNIRILYIESAKTVNEMTLNELVKLTTLWTTGPCRIIGHIMNLYQPYIQTYAALCKQCRYSSVCMVVKADLSVYYIYQTKLGHSDQGLHYQPFSHNISDTPSCSQIDLFKSSENTL